jgi:tRNA(Ile)-lysidine synthase
MVSYFRLIIFLRKATLHFCRIQIRNVRISIEIKLAIKGLSHFMLEKVQSFSDKHELITNNSTILVGVSGGPDSIALLHFLWSQKDTKHLKIVAVHVDHMFRGKQSEEDLVFVESFCRRLGILYESIQIDVAAYRQEKQVSSQVAARECRFHFFTKMMQKYRADSLALGHHGDDQIETILMRLVRGSSLLGSAGIQVKRPFCNGEIIRPFLCITKDDIQKYCEEMNLDSRTDPSNEKDAYTRNRFRHHVLPFLKRENSNVHVHFQKFSEILTEDELFLQELTQQKLNTVIKRKDDQGMLIEIGLLQSMPKPLQRRGIKLILNYLYKDTSPDLSSVHIDSLFNFLASENPSGTLHFPFGLRIVRSYGECEFTFLENEAEPYCIVIPQEGKISLDNGYDMISETCESYPKDLNGSDTFIFDPRLILLPLYVRSRKIGEKMTLKGMKGTKKVKDIFIDQKIPRGQRDTWPIVSDSEGNIIWIPLIKKSSFETDDRQKSKYIILKYTK